MIIAVLPEFPSVLLTKIVIRKVWDFFISSQYYLVLHQYIFASLVWYLQEVGYETTCSFQQLGSHPKAQLVSYHHLHCTNVIYYFIFKMGGGKLCDFFFFFLKTTKLLYLQCTLRDVVLIGRELANLRCKQWLALALTHVVNITDLSCWVMWKEKQLVVDYWAAQHRAHLACQTRDYSNELELLPIT